MIIPSLGLLLLAAGRVVMAQVERVHYGYFAEARPIRVACARGWFDYTASDGDEYVVTCYPQASGNFAASRLDSNDLQIAELGSTPLAQALARGLEVDVVYVDHYKGESQGIYVRASSDDYVGIQNPFDLEGRTLGVPFGSTMHYQVLYLLDLFDLTGKVNVTDMSPTEIKDAWSKKTIDAAACWGAPREYVLKETEATDEDPPNDQDPANTLITAGVMDDWGRPTFNAVAVNRKFAKNKDFLDRFVAILAILNDSFIDNIGAKSPQNVNRWTPQLAPTYIESLSDSLMKLGEARGNPSTSFINRNRQTLDLFRQVSSSVQLRCDYLGGDQCKSPSLLHVALRDTAEFLMQQRVINSMGLLENMGDDTECERSDRFCGSDVINGTFLANADPRVTLDFLDPLGGSYPTSEIGRAKEGDSTCSKQTAARRADGTPQLIGDGADGSPGKSYSDNRECWWQLLNVGCGNTTSTSSSCKKPLELTFKNIRLWSGDYIRVFTDPTMECTADSETKVLLAQITGVDPDIPKVIRAAGCILVEFKTDGNQERSYGDKSNQGDGFRASYKTVDGCTSSTQCSGYECSNGLCQCKGEAWGADCSYTKQCFGTSHLTLVNGEKEAISWKGPNFKSSLYANDLDCIFDVKAYDGAKYIAFETTYDLETAFDFLELYRGSFGSTTGAQLHAVLSSEKSSGTYYIPVDGSGYASIRLVTDSRGRRTGFNGTVSGGGSGGVGQCPTPGASGHMCEFPHCISLNSVRGDVISSSDIDEDFIIGRLVSHQSGYGVPPMPWSSVDVGGCTWSLASKAPPEDAKGIRLQFSSNLDLQPQPAGNVGDKIVIKAGNKPPAEVFVEKCSTNEQCLTHPWQTGNCENGGCIVKRAVDLSFSDLSGAQALLITDISDGGKNYSGFDFDALFLEACPDEGDVHCESAGGECVNGGCICGDIPCACSCDAGLLSKFNTGLFVGIIVALVIIFVGIFVWYRRRKIHKSREQKAIIAEKDEQLEAFRNSVVGMRTASKLYMPHKTAKESAPDGTEKSIDKVKSNIVPLPPPLQKIQWVWKETNSQTQFHNPDMIVGNPADCWVKYDPASNTLLENAYQAFSGAEKKKSKKLRVAYPRDGYEVNFKEMVQTKQQTGFQREVMRFVDVGQPAQQAHQPQVQPQVPSERSEINLDEVEVGALLPEEITDEPQMVLVEGDVLQISSQRQDGWAFGTKLHHHDEAIARELVRIASEGVADSNVFTDTGWFPLDLTEIPTGEELALLQKKVGDTGTLDPPPNWDDIVDPTVVQRHKLREGDPERNNVVKAFKSTLKPPGFPKKVKVVGVERIQNLAMWQSYVVKRQTICYRETGFQGGDASADSAAAQRQALERIERSWLFHGTNVEVLEKILQQGFNRSFCGKNATMYGKGVYFARDASYSAYPTYSMPDAKGVQYMMACRVIVGEYCPGVQDALTADVRDPKTQTLYDSTVGLIRNDTMADPSIYVTYHDAQAYPEYLIKFKLS